MINLTPTLIVMPMITITPFYCSLPLLSVPFVHSPDNDFSMVLVACKIDLRNAKVG